MIGELCEMIVDDSRVVLTPELVPFTHDCFAQSRDSGVDSKGKHVFHFREVVRRWQSLVYWSILGVQ